MSVSHRFFFAEMELKVSQRLSEMVGDSSNGEETEVGPPIYTKTGIHGEFIAPQSLQYEPEC